MNNEKRAFLHGVNYDIIKEKSHAMHISTLEPSGRGRKL